MKVLMLSWEFPPYLVGGLGKHVIELVPQLIAHGVEVHLVVPRLAGGEQSEPLTLPDGTPATNGSRVHRVDVSGVQANFFTNTWHDNILLQEYCGALLRRENSFDLIHNHDWLSGFAATAVKHWHHLPLLATVHATEMGRNLGQLHNEMQRQIHQAEWWLTYEAWRLITTSRYMLWELSTYFELPASKIDIIPNGVDPGNFDALRGADLSQFRLAYAMPGQPIVYYVGRIVPEKGLAVLVDAVPRVLSEWPGVRFVIAGGGDYANELREQAVRLGVSANVLLPGRISDDVRDKLYMVADCAAFPSLYEPFGIVALEAMAARCPVVVSDVGGLAEVVEHEVTGIKVQPDDPVSLAEGILYTLKNPKASAKRVQNAERVVRKQYNWHHIARMTVDVYRKVVKEAKAGDWAYRT
ncbi:MAG TPA: glycosyltransferase family 4 protein [Chloroflexia bacterium]|nr:glycosyltransferase family 4 protein [Chloroflexia bacterium]